MQATERTKPTILDLPDEARQATAHDLLRTDKGSWVYFLTLGDEVVYVGETVQLRSRITWHIGRKDFDGVFVMQVDAESRLSIESHLIVALEPCLNGPRGRPRLPDKQKCVGMGFTIPPELFEALEARRKKEKLTRSAAVTAALREWLAG